MGIQTKKLFLKWQLQKNKLSKVLLTRSGRPMMSTRVESSTRKRPRSSSRIPSVTSDPAMRSSLPSTRTALVPSRSQRWLFSSSNFSVATEQLEHQGGYNDDEHMRALSGEYNSQLMHDARSLSWLQTRPSCFCLATSGGTASLPVRPSSHDVAISQLSRYCSGLCGVASVQ